MTRTFRTVAAGAVVGGALAIGAAIGAALAEQPHMQAALDALKSARAELVAGTPTKGGHRVEALRLTNLAIGEVEKAIEFDRTH
jgi:hypothetical protein